PAHASGRRRRGLSWVGSFPAWRPANPREYIEPMLFTRLLGTSFAGAGWLPSRCVVCRAWPAQRICVDCASTLAPLRRRCPRCALPLADGAPACGHCLREPSGLDACVAVVDYAWPGSGLVTQLKFHGAPGVASA